jgi:2-polyprenyl-3-methyl-5-hydroxy-6-metoxy-1,4-benzoquinol methylase
MSAADSPYGTGKRLAFCLRLLEKMAPRLVIDVGCGTGTGLTRPLAEKAPRTQFVGIDSDGASLDYARRDSPPANLSYAAPDELPQYRHRADLVIASEVLEHVEDPEGFLAELRGLLHPSGRLLLTVPNGWGPFELATLVENLARLSGALGAARRMKRLIAEAKVIDRLGEDTLAVSPHIHFFSWQELRHLFARSGLAVSTYQPRTFLCGFALDPLLRLLRLVDWNARVADRLPPRMVSDWMFVLEPVDPMEAPVYRRGGLNSWRRWLNEKRWGIA